MIVGLTFLYYFHQQNAEVTLHNNKHQNTDINHNLLTFANASKRVALTPGVLAIFWPTAAKILQFGRTAT